MSIERELATHETEIKHIQADIDKMVKDIEDIRAMVATITTTLSEAKGGWRVLMVLGGAGGVLGSAVTYLVQHWMGK